MKAFAFGIVAVAIGLAVNPGTPQAADATFAHFVGNWSGSGTISVKDGGRERIRCRGTNTGSGNTLKLGLICASDSYKFELTSDITNEGGNVSGSWNETTRAVYGSLSGTNEQQPHPGHRAERGIHREPVDFDPRQPAERRDQVAGQRNFGSGDLAGTVGTLTAPQQPAVIC